MSQLPSILDLHAFADGQHRFRFIKPSAGNEVIALNETDSKLSPQPQVMAIRKLTLPPETIVPVHVHPKGDKEKIYIALGASTYLQVVIWEDGTPETYIIQHLHDRVIVRPGRPHALIFSPIHASEFHVITTSQDPNDIEWELDIETLLKNEHLKR